MDNYEPHLVVGMRTNLEGKEIWEGERINDPAKALDRFLNLQSGGDYEMLYLAKIVRSSSGRELVGL